MSIAWHKRHKKLLEASASSVQSAKRQAEEISYYYRDFIRGWIKYTARNTMADNDLTLGQRERLIGQWLAEHCKDIHREPPFWPTDQD